MISSGQFRSAVGAEFPWRIIKIDEIHIAYNDIGDNLKNLVIVCLHAIGHGAGDFKSLQGVLSKDYRVISLDFPYHGNSSDDVVPVSVQRYTELLALFLEQLNLEKVILIGNSMGGTVALQYAFLYPLRVQALVLENPGGLDSMDRVKIVFTKLMSKLFSQGNKKSWWYKKGLSDYYRYLVLPKQSAQEQREKIIASAWEIALPLAQAWQSFGNETSDLRFVAESINCPVFFAWAVQDKIVQLRRCLSTIQKFPNATLQKFQAGHCPHLETPREFESAIVTFLNTIEAHAVLPTHC